jgi:hypothetical protein
MLAKLSLSRYGLTARRASRFGSLSRLLLNGLSAVSAELCAVIDFFAAMIAFHDNCPPFIFLIKEFLS